MAGYSILLNPERITLSRIFESLTNVILRENVRIKFRDTLNFSNSDIFSTTKESGEETVSRVIQLNIKF